MKTKILYDLNKEFLILKEIIHFTPQLSTSGTGAGEEKGPGNGSLMRNELI